MVILIEIEVIFYPETIILLVFPKGRPTKSRLEAQSENLSSLSESLSSSSYSEFSSSFLGSANVDSSLSCIPND